MSDLPGYPGRPGSPDRQPRLELLAADGETRLRIGRATVPGDIEQVDVLDGLRLVSTTRVDPPARGLDTDLDLRLARWDGPIIVPTVSIYYRCPQPASLAVPPLARGSFRLPPLLEEATVSDRSAAAVPPSAAAPAETLHSFDAALDFGTSRSVSAVFDRSHPRRNLGGLPADWLERARPYLHGREPAPGDDEALFVDRATAGVPEDRARAWREIFASAPLAHHYLRATRPRSSVLSVDEDGGLDFYERGIGDVTPIPGAKRYMLTPDAEIPRTGVTGMQLFPEVYRRLKALAERDLDLPTPISRVSLTYPVRLPPDLRERLREKIREAIGLPAARVTMDFDEAVAAAGFSMLQRFGEDVILGVEAFKLTARCPEGRRAWEDRQLWQRAHSWHENLLVIDVGGGTTDVALVKVAVVDDTPGELGDVPGRYYRLQPSRLASGGRLNLGGEQLTLGLFLLLKERLGVPDTLTRYQGVTGTEAVRRRELFDTLWQAAEEVKLTGLAGADPVAVRVVIADPAAQDDQRPGDAPLVTVTWPASAATARPPRRDAVVITAADLEDVLARVDVVELAAALASGIARGGLQAEHEQAGGLGAPAQSVDRVLLSGGTMMARTLRDRLADSLRRHLTADGMDSTFELEFDPEFSKQGTALGGAFLKAVQLYQPPLRSDEVTRKLREGNSTLAVDSSKLYVNLGADFHYRVRNYGDPFEPEPVFRRGERLQQLSGGRAVIASEQGYGLRENIELHRLDVRRGESVGSQPPKLSLWATSGCLTSQRLVTELTEAGVTLLFEIDQDEQVTLLLCKGRSADDVAHVLVGPVVPTEQLPGGLLVPAGAAPDGSAAPVSPTVRYSLHLDAHTPGVGVQLGRPVVAAGTVIPPGGLLRPLDGIGHARALYWEVTESGLADSGPAASGSVPGSGSASGSASGHSHGDVPLLANVPPGAAWLSIDPDGAVRLHEERPAPRRVDAPEDLLDAPPGTVYSERMTSGRAFTDDEDPFNGTW